MEVGYFAPLERGLGRMKQALFKPFDIGKWFAVGFTAFLAGLASTNGGGGGGSSIRNNIDPDWRHIRDFPSDALEWLTENPGWFMFGLISLVLLIAIGLALLWLSSRGRFMFLHNVARNESQITKPWGDYARQGNSLFLWRLVFGLICLIPVVFFIVLGFQMAVEIADTHDAWAEGILGIVAFGLFALVVGIVIAFIELFLDSFVVPLMYREKISTTAAWGRFLQLFTARPWPFILYGLIVFVINILVGIALVMVALLTCCVGALVLAIPYISSVITLPIYYTLRAYSLEFLEQFGPDYQIFELPSEAE